MVLSITVIEVTAILSVNFTNLVDAEVVANLLLYLRVKIHLR